MRTETRTDRFGADRGRCTDERRRLTLEVLASRADSLGLEELAAAVTRRAGLDGSATVERVALELHHGHLPRLADRGVLDYDPNRRRVEASFDRE
ncbi:hypothetical protein GWG54_11865 [Natronococcus sp. JC468]|uniref:DUF7344 domain-containing protein n=1 Tax=Natronococcus sp. JC468 TaxID=1961921 RepID=UPI00143C607D|nr:hypothetical protein [Natronococcus sp. JC468]NKE36506.1 hypothetical protein [Natronococcus sp. JC468]